MTYYDMNFEDYETESRKVQYGINPDVPQADFDYEDDLPF